MSFLQFSAAKKKRSKPKRTKVARKHQWDDTTSDMNVHKASPEYLARRKTLATSANIDLARLELEEKRIARARQEALTDSVVRCRSSFSCGSSSGALVRELLYTDDQYSSLMSKTDEALSIARDVFGDEGRRFTAIPSVTTAPSFEEKSERPDGLILSHPMAPTKLEMLNSTVMQKTALNETKDTSEDDNLITHDGLPRDECQHAESTVTVAGSACTTGQVQDSSGLAGNNSSRRAALNCTTNLVANRPQGKAAERNKSHPGVEDLQKMLQWLESELSDFELQSGVKPIRSQPSADTFSGYTVALVNANAKLTHYLKQTSIKLRAETAIREQLTEDVINQRKLVNGLTADLMDTQERLCEVAAELKSHKEETGATINRLEGLVMRLSTESTPVVASKLITEQNRADTCNVVGMPWSLLNTPTTQTTPTKRIEGGEFALPPRSPVFIGMADVNDSSSSGTVHKVNSSRSQSVLRPWPADVSNRQVHLPLALTPSSVALQTQIELLNREHTLAVSRFHQLQQFQENLVSAKRLPASVQTEVQQRPSPQLSPIPSHQSTTLSQTSAVAPSFPMQLQ